MRRRWQSLAELSARVLDGVESGVLGSGGLGLLSSTTSTALELDLTELRPESSTSGSLDVVESLAFWWEHSSKMCGSPRKGTVF